MSQSAEEFVKRFAEAWRTRSAAAFLALWHPEGVLRSPLLDGPIPGSRIGELNEMNKASTPDLVWTLEAWASHGDTVFVEFRCRGTVGGEPMEWCGVDRFTLRDGRIAEEVGYFDAHAFWETVDPSMRRGSLVSLDRAGNSGG